MNAPTTVSAAGIARDQLKSIVERIERLTASDLIALYDQTEVWRPIADYPGYEVSSWGRVSGKRVEILVAGKTEGYHHVSLSRDGEVTTVRVAHLVARAFIGPPPFEGAHAAHNNGDTDNNRVSNLRWATALDNQADVDRHGNRVKGSAVHGARLTEGDIPNIRRRAAAGERYADIAADFGVSISTVSLIKLGKIWCHVGA
jgi:hypothetical protein